MTDRLLDLANGRWTAPLVRALGLPQPRPLRRLATNYAPREFAGSAALLLATPGGFAADACREGLAAQGATFAGSGVVNTVVGDLTGLARASDLDFLHRELRPALQRLADGGRVLLLANAGANGPEAAACARSLDGFMRSLAREIGRSGATANCLSVEPHAMLAGPLAFFCSDRSAYVSGQLLQVRAADAPASRAPRTVVVTGAAGGIGAATARRLAAEGDHVVCVDVPAARAALASVAAGIGGSALALDITAADAGRQLADAATARGGIDVLVHNAGITRDRTLARMSQQEWDSVLAVNLRAVIAIDAALDAAGALREGAREICLASISGIAGNRGQSNYAASKAALIGYVAARAQQLAPRGVTVNAVAPGFIETTMTQRIPFMVREVGRRFNALAQGGLPEDVAEAIAFLGRPDAQGVSGQTLRVCGQSFLGA